MDARQLSAKDESLLHHYTALYKQHRHWLSNATYWQLPSNNDMLIASGMVAPTQTDALFCVILVDSLRTQRLRGLKEQARYRVKLSSINTEQFAPFNKIMPEWCTNGVLTTGELLHKLGLSLPVMPPQSALMLHCSLETN